MSQYPPTTPPPPANYPTQGGDYSMRPRGNGMAVASLVCSLVGFCVPGIGGLLGIIFGVLGLGRAKETSKGAGMAWAGIIVGVVTLVCWAFLGLGLSKGVAAARVVFTAPRTAAKQYVLDLSAANIDAAMNDSSGISKDEVTAESGVIQPLGAFMDMTSTQFNILNSTCTLGGKLTCANGTKDYTIILTGGGSNWKVTSATFQ